MQGFRQSEWQKYVFLAGKKPYLLVMTIIVAIILCTQPVLAAAPSLTTVPSGSTPAAVGALAVDAANQQPTEYSISGRT